MAKRTPWGLVPPHLVQSPISLGRLNVYFLLSVLWKSSISGKWVLSLKNLPRLEFFQLILCAHIACHIVNVKLVTTEDVLRASFIFNRANMHLPPALCMHFVIISISPFSSQLLGEIRSNKNCPGCLDSLESRAGWYPTLQHQLKINFFLNWEIFVLLTVSCCKLCDIR